MNNSGAFRPSPEGAIVYNGSLLGVSMGVLRNWCLCVSLLLSSAVLASPVMSHPDMSLGSNPVRNFTGSVALGEPAVLLEVPAGQEFVLTSFLPTSEVFHIKKDGEVALWWWPLSKAYFASGLSRITFGSGSVLSIENTGRDGSGTQNYYVEGYLTAEHSPNRFWTGDISGAVPVAVFTNSEGKPFLVRTILLGSGDCAVYLDGVTVLDEGFFQNYGAASPTVGFLHRRGNLLVPPGATMEIAAPSGAGCEYYVEGQYLQP